MAERERQQEQYGLHRTYTTEINNDGQSLEGYQKAWENLSTKLEAPKNDYTFTPNNKYKNTEVTERKDFFDEGMVLFGEGKIREAVLAFEADLQEDQTRSEAWRMLGTVCSFCQLKDFVLSIAYSDYFRWYLPAEILSHYCWYK